jgi:glycosyltransferase involved in cell wall biosynthesis
MSNQVPRITLLMPVFNGEKYLREALDSLLQQTFSDFELLVIDDGSSDGSADIVRSYRDSRIRFEQNERNLGLITTLNRGLDLARGEFIARMDCDDISLPNRLERQIRFMEEHPEVGVIGTWFEKIRDNGTITVKIPADDATIRFFLIFDNAFLHSSILLRRSLLERHGLRFDADFPYAEDYEFWVRCASYTQVANIPEVLVRYRDHSENTSNRFRKEQNSTADRVRRRHLAALGLHPDEAELALHLAITNYRFSGDFSRLVTARDWLSKLVEEVRKALNLSEHFLNDELDSYWYGACGALADHGLSVWRLFRSSPIGCNAKLQWQVKLFLRCLFRIRITEATVA